METVTTHSGKLIRITEERWFHIVENHDELAGRFQDVVTALESPEYVIAGYAGARIALQTVRKGKYLAVVFRETNGDGFVITAYYTTKIELSKEMVLWPKR